MISLFTSYRELCIEIEWMEGQLDMLKVEQEDWWIGGRLFPIVSMSNAAERVDKINKNIEQLDRALAVKNRFKKQVQAWMASLESIEYKVAYKRYVENKLLYEIADELNVTYDYVRKIHARVKNYEECTFSTQTN